MNYVAEVHVPANTPIDAPVEMELWLAEGVITRVEMEFEKWCANLLHIAIFRFEQQIYPSTPAEWYDSDGETVEFGDYFEVFEEPHFVKLRGWNEDDTYEWTCRVRLTVIPRFVAEAMYGHPSKSDRKKLLEAFGLAPSGR